MGVLGLTCGTGVASSNALAPDPSKFVVDYREDYKDCYLLGVTYPNCTNFEGKKIILMRGECKKMPQILDPHFAKNTDVVARFAPTVEGLAMARVMAKNYHLVMLFIADNT